MKYDNYKKSRDLSWKILYECGINSLPVKVTKVAKFYDIKIVKDTQGFLQPTESGLVSFVNDKPYIIIDDSDSTQRKRFTIAHELGHILLNHNYNCLIKEMEEEANVFATRLLEPACVL